MTKQDLVLLYMQGHDGITQYEAYGLTWQGKPARITRLSAIIFELKKDGFPIEAVREKGKDCFGNTMTWVRYKLV